MAENMVPDQTPSMSGTITEPTQPSTPDMTATSQEMTPTSPHADAPRSQGIFQWLWSFFQTKDQKNKDKEEIQEQLPHKQQCTQAAIRLQAAARCWMARQDFKRHRNAAIKLQAAVKCWMARRDFRKLRNAAIKLQAAVRCWMARRVFQTFIREKNPPPSIIMKLCSLAQPMEPVEMTVLQELELIDLKAEVIAKMRLIQQLKEDLNNEEKKTSGFQHGTTMLEDLVSQFSKLKRNNKRHIQEAMSMDRERMSEVRKKTERLDTYQHFFYHLQTQPTYLAKLICLMSEYQYTTLAERLLHRLYKRASTPREEYYLMKFLETHLQYEVENNCTHIEDILDSRSMVINTIFSFYREAAKYNVVVQKLAPAIGNILCLSSSISDKPHAMCKMADQVIEAISVESLPYGIRYAVKVLRRALLKKFPLASEKRTLRTLGRFLYQYLQPAIEEPHDYGLIPAELFSDSLQGENLMTVAMLVRHTMSNQLFPADEDTSTWNWYILNKFHHFSRFFKKLHTVPEPEQEFDLDYYSDFIPLRNPTVDLPAEDIVSIHSLLVEVEEEVFTEQKDVVYKLLKELGPVPHMRDIIAAAAHRDQDLTATDIRLSLSSICVPREKEDTEREILRVVTQKLIFDVIHVQPGESLLEVLMTPASVEQEEEHSAIMSNTTVSENEPISYIMKDQYLPLEKKKEKILSYLRTLHDIQDPEILVNVGGRDMLNNISKYISRKNQLWLQHTIATTKLTKVMEDLQTSSRYYQERIDWHQWYRKNCLEDLDSQERSRKKEYTAAQLQKKGVIVDLEERKQLTIEFETPLRIQISADHTRACLDIAGMIDIHYNSNQTTMELFSGINVSLLLYMVYSKLYDNINRRAIYCFHK